MKCAVIRLDTGLPFIADAELVTNDDGSVSFSLGEIGDKSIAWAGQEPNQYGVRHDQHEGNSPQAYQRATLAGSTVVFVTRPQDAPMVYLIGQGKAY